MNSLCHVTCLDQLLFKTANLSTVNKYSKWIKRSFDCITALITYNKNPKVDLGGKK